MALRFIAAAFAALIATIAAAARASDAQQLQLLNRVLAGTTCQETHYNGRICEYSIGSLNFSIKGVGGPDTVIGFGHSDIDDELYAVMYFGCVVVVPGRAHSGGYDLKYGVHVSPVTGNAYATSDACKAANVRMAK